MCIYVIIHTTVCHIFNKTKQSKNLPIYIDLLSIDKYLSIHKIIKTVVLLYKYKEKEMEKFVCTVCGYVYDPEENGGVAFEDLPEDYVCPLCGVGKDLFQEQ